MRAGPLSDSKIVNLLNNEFVNAWLLLSDIERPFRSIHTEDGRRLASVALREFTFPVESLVFSSTGSVLEQLDYNGLLDVGPDDRSRRYFEFLTRSLQPKAP